MFAISGLIIDRVCCRFDILTGTPQGVASNQGKNGGGDGNHIQCLP
jgi:hypothetical protein